MRLTLAAVFGVLGAMGWLIVGAVMLVLGPKFGAIFRDFGVALPGVTLLALRVSGSPAVLIGVVLGAVGLSGVAVARRWWALAILLCLGAGAAWLTFFIAMQAPLLSMTESLGAGA